MYLLVMAWTLCVNNDELLNFEGTRAELEELVTPLLLPILAANDAKGGDIDAEAMKRGIAWARYFMEQQARAVQKALRDGSSNRIADRIRERSEFYSGWLEPRLKEFAENNGMAP